MIIRHFTLVCWKQIKQNWARKNLNENEICINQSLNETMLMYRISDKCGLNELLPVVMVGFYSAVKKSIKIICHFRLNEK